MNITNKVIALGIMSGTSLDGIDLALCQFQLDATWKYELLDAQTFEYTEQWRRQLQEAPDLTGLELIKLTNHYTVMVAQLVGQFLQNQPQPSLIAAHGHTIFHLPADGYNLQMLNGELFATLLRNTVVCDFRSKDVSLGGQGAPLVPVADKYLFGRYGACLNLGGIANISYEKNTLRQAFDICPVNMALNFFANKLEVEYDRGGRIAASGKVKSDLLSTLNDLTYYRQPPPKSLGREWFEMVFLPAVAKHNYSPEDVLSTLIQHISEKIIDAIPHDVQNVLCTGGGAHNQFLMDQLHKQTAAKMYCPGQKLIDFKEAIAFAFLGVLRLRNEVNSLASVTGASRDSCGGVVHQPL